MGNEVSTPAPAVLDPASSKVPPSQLPADASNRDLVVIRPRSGWIGLDWRELFRFRELLYFFVWRDIKVRYKQTVLGFSWAIIQPTLNALMATLIFGKAAGFSKWLPEGVPYVLFALVGQIPWQFFSTSLANGGMSLVNQQHLLTKTYFPRLFVPTGVVGGAIFDMGMAMIVLACFYLWYGMTPHWSIIFLPMLVVLTALTALAVAYTLSAMTVTYRDVRFIVPFLTQLWMMVSFVMFPLPLDTIIKHPWVPWVLALNPMYGIIHTYRWMFGVSPNELAWNPWHLVISIVITAVMLTFGLFYFKKTERRFADIA